jgi:hypothetical protein
VSSRAARDLRTPWLAAAVAAHLSVGTVEGRAKQDPPRLLPRMGVIGQDGAKGEQWANPVGSGYHRARSGRLPFGSRASCLSAVCLPM